MNTQVEDYRVKLSFYVPSSHVEHVKDAVFAAGGGNSGRYDRGCWQTLGIGQFRPLAGSHPTIGEVGELSQVGEFKVELLCQASRMPAIIAALRQAHPYEEPAYDCYRVMELDN